jgi:uncharacterized membrane protein YeaQ/YmgE (transglycosylase-associated protein family)
MTFEGFVTWVVVGLVTGALARVAAKDGDRGLIMDATLGLGGALMGSTLFQVIGGSQEAGWFVMAPMMCVGAAGVIVVQRTGGRGRSSLGASGSVRVIAAAAHVPVRLGRGLSPRSLGRRRAG